MDIQVIEKEEMKVIGISWSGNYSQFKEIPQLFAVMEERLDEIAYKTEEPVLVAPFHSRETDFTYYVTKPVEKIAAIPDGMVAFTIPSKNYCVATHSGRPEEVENTYLQMFSWMKEYGYDQDHQALSLEIYREEHKQLNSSGDLHFEIYLPIKVYREY
jgi:AraC family transcriptional regulator